MISGWRAWLHHASRRRASLERTAVGIVVSGFLLAWLVCASPLSPDSHPVITTDPVEHAIRREWQRLRHAPGPEPRALGHWLRKLTPSLAMLAEVLDSPPASWAKYAKEGSVLAYEVRSLLVKHLGAAKLIELAEDYLAACLLTDPELQKAAAARVQAATHSPNPLPLAHEWHASLLLREDADSSALEAMMREGQLFPDAQSARETSVRLALLQQEREKLAQMAQAGWTDNLPPLLEHDAGALLGNILIQWRGLLRYRMQGLPLAALLLTGMSAGLWYILLVMHTPRCSWRWTWPLGPVVAGIASIWPTISLIAWQEQEKLGLNGTVEATTLNFPMDLWHLILGVGLREESCKLALAAFFMPWLVWRRMPGMALMTGAFVGLGFALEENVDYYQSMGGAVALPRFLSANFMHVAMTGLTTHALYEMLHSRFASADRFLLTFAAVVTAHAVYDYAPPEASGLDMYLPMLTLAFIAWRFWDQVEAEMPIMPQPIAPAAVFLIGGATIIAASLIITAMQEKTWSRVIEASISCASILPVALIYWRRFERTLSAE